MPQKGKKGKIFLGMSGGVDSSVSAALLMKAGYEVVGVFIKVWEPAGVPCTWRAERREAMRVAAHLGIPLLTLDLSKKYEKEVVDYMIKEYKRGRTPNPDVMCNRYVKFGAFYDWAIAQGADYVATGHYAKVGFEKKQTLPAHGQNGKFATKVSFSLRQSADENKDQTYFLWDIKRECLPHIIFPIGHLTKTGVRRLAKKFGLPNAEKRDSQGLCFVGQLDLKSFLKRQIGIKPGQVVNEKGEVIGEHDGAIFYTIGERHGFNVRSSTSNTDSLYVVARNIKKNLITVSTKDHLLKKVNREVVLEKVNWLVPDELITKSRKLKARIRHRGELLPCVAKVTGNKVVVTFSKTPDALASGQSLVLYDKDICLGGGIIA
jgi:tRNA-specific 2-thiouridylase